MLYWFWNKERTSKNHKRLFIAEMEELVENICKGGIINKTKFKSCCPRTNGDGGCGYAVILSVLSFCSCIQPLDRENWKVDSGKAYALLREPWQ